MLTALAPAGLRIEFLHEHAITLFQRFGTLVRRVSPAGTASRMYEAPDGQPRVPLMYSLRARLDRA